MIENRGEFYGQPIMSEPISPDLLEQPKISIEKVTTDYRFDRVEDAVPLVVSWGLVGIKPRPGLIRRAAVHRAAGEYYNPYDEPGIGLEDKKRGIIQADKLAEHYAKEGRLLREHIKLMAPGSVSGLDELFESGQIRNGHSEEGREQLLKIAQADLFIAGLVRRENVYPNRGKGHPAYDPRKKLEDFYLQSGVKEENLIEYSHGKRTIAIPKGDEVGIKETEKRSLEADLRRLSSQERRDWELLRSAVKITSDPKVAETLEAYRDLRDLEKMNPTDTDGIDKIRKKIVQISLQRILLQKR